MKDAEELQARLDRLEAGESLEACLADLPEAEAGALRLAAALRALPIPQRDRERIAEQRLQLLRYAERKLSTTAGNGQEGTKNGLTPAAPGLSAEDATPSWIDVLRWRIDWLLSQRGLAVGLAFLLLFIFLIGGLAGMFGEWDDGTIYITSGEDGLLAGDGEPPGSETSLDSSIDSQDNRSQALPPTPGGTAIAEVNEESELLLETPITPEDETLPPTSTPDSRLTLPRPQAAALHEIRGLVEIQTADGTWQQAADLGSATAGQRLRTGPLSSAVLVFHDGSQVYLGASTEIAIEELNVPASDDGPRRVILTQPIGASEHRLRPRDGDGSHYEVRTPAGSGVAQGTTFDVHLNDRLRGHFSVVEGMVEVTNLRQAVSVGAGELSIVMAGRAPSAPVLPFVGEGIVSQTGPTWIVAGQPLEVAQNATVTGEPRTGDLVHVEGHLESDGTAVADRLLLLRRAINQRFSLTGEVEGVEGTIWTIAGQTIVLDESSLLAQPLQVGDAVRVEGIMAGDGTLRAERLMPLDADSPFYFVGVVQAIEETAWRISGYPMLVDAGTQLPETVAVGDLVAVAGQHLNDGSWQVSAIKPAGVDAEFSLAGPMQNDDGWRVAGMALGAREWTTFESGIGAGEQVRVIGAILPDGNWVASTVESLDLTPAADSRGGAMTLVGMVSSTAPWTMSGIRFAVDNNTRLIGEVTAGNPVWAGIVRRSDGSWRAVWIQAARPDFGLGCFSISAHVIDVEGNQILLHHWPAISLSDGVEVEGEIKPNSIISFAACFEGDGTMRVRRISVVQQAADPPADPPAPTQTPTSPAPPTQPPPTQSPPTQPTPTSPPAPTQPPPPPQPTQPPPTQPPPTEPPPAPTQPPPTPTQPPPPPPGNGNDNGNDNGSPPPPPPPPPGNDNGNDNEPPPPPPPPPDNGNDNGGPPPPPPPGNGNDNGNDNGPPPPDNGNDNEPPENGNDNGGGGGGNGNDNGNDNG